MPKIVDHVAYKKQLVEASFELIASRGYAALSMRDLARALRISAGTLYHYFDSRLGLFEAILQHYGVDNVKSVTLAEPQTKTFAEGLDVMIGACEQGEAMWAKLVLLQVDAYREPDTKLLEIYNTVFTAESTKAYLSKLLRIDDPDVIDLFRALTLGLILQRVLSKKNVQWSAQKRVLFEAFNKYAKN